MSESLRTLEKELQDKINKMVNVERKVETHYLNGQIKEQGQLVKGKRHGVWKEYYENGNLKLKEQYIAGGLNGARKEYFEDGKMKSEFNFKNNKYNGYQKQYDNQGKLLIEGEYINDKLHGDVKYYENGELYLIEKYDEDKKIEEQKIRDIKEKGEEKLAEKEKKNEIEKLEDGKYKVELWHNETAFERAIYPNENINDYKPLERKIYENGKLYSEAYFSYEKNEELSTVYNENGEKKLKTLVKFNEGIRISDNYFEGTEQINKREYLDINTFELEKQEIFNIEGKLLETSNWDDGELLSSKKYWMNGNLKEEKEQNDEEGYFKEKKYREDGSIEVEGTFNLEDEKHGKWKEYDINGNLKLEETYKDGKLDGVSKKIITLGGVCIHMANVL
ncbi:MAG: toxin-antitoxin system YwqK family antitoxin, partial [Cetobacterium sp.]|uniref:toxin-antitoxin system YwqK family antitoxin n=1 Tax=Cetobacterium sp. TaxID=2071632 RepID=UPI003EE72835